MAIQIRTCVTCLSAGHPIQLTIFRHENVDGYLTWCIEWWNLICFRTLEYMVASWFRKIRYNPHVCFKLLNFFVTKITRPRSIIPVFSPFPTFFKLNKNRSPSWSISLTHLQLNPNLIELFIELQNAGLWCTIHVSTALIFWVRILAQGRSTQKPTTVHTSLPSCFCCGNEICVAVNLWSAALIGGANRRLSWAQINRCAIVRWGVVFGATD